MSKTYSSKSRKLDISVTLDPERKSATFVCGPDVPGLRNCRFDLPLDVMKALGATITKAVDKMEFDSVIIC